MKSELWPQEKIGILIEQGLITEQIDGNHGELYPKADEFVSDGVPYLSANCIENGRVDIRKAKFLTQERAETLKKGKAKRNDVLFAHNATVGPTAILREAEFAVLSTTLTLYRCNESRLSSEYLFQFLSSSLFRRQYERVMGQST
jgi:type I restriction enzyme S subunit